MIVFLNMFNWPSKNKISVFYRNGLMKIVGILILWFHVSLLVRIFKHVWNTDLKDTEQVVSSQLKLINNLIVHHHWSL